MKSELCKSCIHTNVCMKDKNIIGDTFFLANPMLFDNSERLREFEKREADGFPCDDYINALELNHH